jgi:hypothetical protein
MAQSGRIRSQNRFDDFSPSFREKNKAFIKTWSLRYHGGLYCIQK